jgi:hypothetical protein
MSQHGVHAHPHSDHLAAFDEFHAYGDPALFHFPHHPYMAAAASAGAAVAAAAAGTRSHVTSLGTDWYLFALAWPSPGKRSLGCYYEWWRLRHLEGVFAEIAHMRDAGAKSVPAMPTLPSAAARNQRLAPPLFNAFIA